MLHKLRRAMVRPGRDRLSGTVEVDETYWGAEESGLIGRLSMNKAIIAVAVEEDGRKIGRVRLQTIPNLTRAALHGFIAASVEPGSTVRTDGFKSYLGLDGYIHQRHVQSEPSEDEHVLPRVHRIIGLLKLWLMGTHQGAVSAEHLDAYLNEFTFASTAGPRHHAANCSIDWRNKPFRLSPFPSRNWSNHNRLCLVASSK